MKKLAYTIEEAMKIVPLSRPSWYRAIKSGEVPSQRIGTRIFIPASYIEKFGMSEEAKDEN